MLRCCRCPNLSYPSAQAGRQRCQECDSEMPLYRATTIRRRGSRWHSQSQPLGLRLLYLAMQLLMCQTAGRLESQRNSKIAAINRHCRRLRITTNCVVACRRWRSLPARFVVLCIVLYDVSRLPSYLVLVSRPSAVSTQATTFCANSRRSAPARNNNSSLSRETLSHFVVELRQLPIFVLDRLDFYRAAWNADAVLRWEFCLSVRLSNACIVTKRRKICRDFYTVRKII